MNRVLSVARREMQGYFNSPVAWLFIVSFVASCGIFFFFVQGFFVADKADMRSYFSLMPAMFSILIPALTMRLWAEEKKQGTYELLMTMPFTESDLVLGKYLATMAVLCLALVLTLPVPIMISAFGELDAGQIAAEYIGVLLLASASSALGQMLSSFMRNQISAFIVSVIVLAGLNLLSQISLWLSVPSVVSRVLNWISLNYHFISFGKGVLDTRDLLYFVILTAGFLYITMKNLTLGKWS